MWPRRASCAGATPKRPNACSNATRRTKTVVLPASTPGGYSEVFDQMTKAMVTSQES